MYRVIMALLYRGRYLERFAAILEQLDEGTTSVCELCFGDTVLAEACRDRGIEWTGVDLNPGFCRRARRMELTVLEGDVLEVELPQADSYVMAGSLYHFHDRLGELLEKVLDKTGHFVISEPVRNLSSRTDGLGWLARRLSDPGDGAAPFRYDEMRLRRALDREQARIGFTYRTIGSERDLLIVVEA